MNLRSATFCTALVLIMSTELHAQNTWFLSQSAVAHLNPADVDLVKDSLQTALNQTEDGGELTWENPDSGANGTIRVLDTHPDYGTQCRRLQMTNQASGRKSGGNYRMCKSDDDIWRFAPNQRSS